MRHTPYILLATFVLTASCLEPPDNDETPLSSLFADPNIPDDMYPHVQDTASPEQLAQFTSNIAYLRGFADGRPIWYWNVDGANSTIIAPLFRIFDRQGRQFDRTIIDVIPGDAGYTPWWRIVDYELTDLHDGELIRSRAALDAALQLGLVRLSNTSTTVVNCPVTIAGTAVPVSTNPAENQSTKWVWYRDQRVDWVVFTAPFEVPLEVDEMPKYPVYVLQRINQGLPLYEFVTGVDITGDGVLNDSNNIFSSGLGGPRYSPLWFVSFVRTEADYLSIDSSTTTRNVGLSAEDQFYDVEQDRVISSQVVGKPIDMENVLVNCPIQQTMGVL